MNDMTISILGCGWLGLPVAQHLIKLGFSVKGSTTTPDKRLILEQSNIQPFLITAAPELSGNDMDLFFQSRILFLNIPFRRNLKDPHYYKQQIDSVIAQVETSPVEFIIFASSTSVYPTSMSEALESVSIVPDNPRSEVLIKTEQSLLDNSNFKTTVIRFAGLYGGNRQIGRILAGRKGLSDGSSPVNLIHLEDCVEIVAQMIKKDIHGEVINACSDEHPTKQEIYTKAALHYGLEPPRFTDQPQTRFKIVNNTKLKETLGYTFKYSDPMSF